MIPKFAIVEQILPSESISDLSLAVKREFSRMNLETKVTAGMTVAITAGSRGIHRIDEIIRQVVLQVKALGGNPFVVPAMGSHGGATAIGQFELLQELNITAESVGAPIISSLETVEIGVTACSLPVSIDRYAARAGGIIVIARIKPHTDFRNYIESGLQKMLAIGLGKHKQALAIHRFGVEGLKKFISPAAGIILEKTPVLMGLAIIENACDQTAKIVALHPDEIESQEPRLLNCARSLMPQLPCKDIDILVVGEFGKDISGTGMDTNIIGRVGIPGVDGFGDLKAQYIVALRLTEASHGNALGIGLADFTTERVMNSIDYQAMRENVITSTFVERGKIPLAFPNDRAAIEAALRCVWNCDNQNARIAFIRNTREINRFMVSESLLAELRTQAGIRVLTPLEDIPFDSDGNIPPKMIPLQP